jgi:hypothetical protein
VNNYLEDKESSNVIGVIRGEVEPDRYVIIGTVKRKIVVKVINKNLPFVTPASLVNISHPNTFKFLYMLIF